MIGGYVKTVHKHSYMWHKWWELVIPEYDRNKQMEDGENKWTKGKQMKHGGTSNNEAILWGLI